MKFLDVFNPIKKGSHGLTDEAIYSSFKNDDVLIPLYGGNSQHQFTDRFVAKNTKTVDGDYAEVFEGEGIIISLDGSSGSMTYKKGEVFTLNHHAGFITLNKNGIKSVNLQFFSLFMQNHYKALAVSDSSKTLSLTQIYSDEFTLPEKVVQDNVMESMNGVLQTVEKLNVVYDKISILLNKELSVAYKKYQAQNIKVSSIIDCMSGNSGLTEEFIYSTQQLQGNRYRVKSSSTSEETLIGYVPQCILNGKPLKINTHKETLLVARNGKAGQAEYIVNEEYTINDHAYVLYLKDNCPYKFNLKWFSLQYRSEFMNYSSSSDNGTWNMTGFFNNVSIDIPDYNEQLKIVNLYEKLEKMQSKITEINDKLSSLFSKEIC